MKIVVDSCCELSESMLMDHRIVSVPLKITVGGIEYIDDQTLNVESLLSQIDRTSDVAKTSCPSPEDFLKAYAGDDEIIVITLTGTLSGTYNSARLAKDLALVESPDKKIHLFNTNAASIKETLVLMKVIDLLDAGNNFETIVEKAQIYMDDMQFFFHLDVLDTLVKNGRMSKIKGKIANFLNIKLIMTATENGEIDIYEKMRTQKKALRRLVEIVGEVGHDFEDKILGISYCDCYEKANRLKKEMMEKYHFKEVVLLPMRGLSSTYSNRGGIILSF